MAVYVCKKVQDNIKASSFPNKEDMILYISDYSGDVSDEDCGVEWTKAIDRDGLRNMNVNTFCYFIIWKRKFVSTFY